jgi:hypothetical protein
MGEFGSQSSVGDYAAHVAEAVADARRQMRPSGAIVVAVAESGFGDAGRRPDASVIAAERTRLHNGDYSQRKLSDGYDDVGLAGELAFAAEFGLVPDLSVRRGGDRGVDFRVAAVGSIDVKTYRKPGNLPHEFGRKPADVLVLAGYDQASGSARLIGWEYGPVVASRPARYLGYHTILNHCQPAASLRPMGTLLTACGVTSLPGDRLGVPAAVLSRLVAAGWHPRFTRHAPCGGVVAVMTTQARSYWDLCGARRLNRPEAAAGIGDLTADLMAAATPAACCGDCGRPHISAVPSCVCMADLAAPTLAAYDFATRKMSAVATFAARPPEAA